MKSIQLLKYAFLPAAALIIIMTFQSGSYSQQAAQEAPKKEDKAAVNQEKVESEDLGWRIRDFKPYIKAIEELEKLKKEYSENLLKLAIDEYSTGLDILEDMENEVVNIREGFKKQ